jgi:hypothetical protein
MIVLLGHGTASLAVRSGRHEPDLGNDHGGATSLDLHYAFVMDAAATAFLPMRRFACGPHCYRRKVALCAGQMKSCWRRAYESYE